MIRILVRTIVMICALTATARAEVSIDWVPVGPAAFELGSGLGVTPAGYYFHMGQYEITNAQYADFLNAVASSDPNGLYNANMGTAPRGGITQSGPDGSFVYAVRPNMGNKPVNFVGGADAFRFVNWLGNGQPAGPQDVLTTEDGTYDMSIPIENIRRKGSHPTFILPQFREWLTAGYTDHESVGAGPDYLWLYPMRADSNPTIASSDATGNIANPGPNVANYSSGADWSGQDGNVTTVGSAGPASSSYFGTFDQGGNVAEIIEDSSMGHSPLAVGGSYASPASSLEGTYPQTPIPAMESAEIGFRVALVPCRPTADFDGDDDVSGLDINFAAHILISAVYDCRFDYDSNLVIDGLDVQVFADTLLSGCPANEIALSDGNGDTVCLSPCSSGLIWRADPGIPDLGRCCPYTKLLNPDPDLNGDPSGDGGTCEDFE